MKYAGFAIAAVAIAALLFYHPSRPAVIALPETTSRPATHPSSSRRVEPVTVYVSGAVRNPGLYRLASNARANDAVSAAGGVLADADCDAVNLAARLSDGDHVLVPVRGAAQVQQRSSRSANRARRSVRATPLPVEVNSASADELARIPGIGKALAARIVALREQEGPFPNADALLDVAGMTASRLDRARDYILFDQ